MSDHCTSGEFAAYADGALPPAARARLEAHCAECSSCRAELVDFTRLLHGRTRGRRRAVSLGVAVAAAASVLLFIWIPPGTAPRYREPAVTATVAPRIVAPRGVRRDVAGLVWTAVPHADRYHLTLYDDAGSVVWETETADTLASLPDSVRLEPRQSYFWKVEAQTGWNRWVGSDLVEFSVGAARP